MAGLIACGFEDQNWKVKLESAFLGQIIFMIIGVDHCYPLHVNLEVYRGALEGLPGDLK